AFGKPSGLGKLCGDHSSIDFDVAQSAGVAKTIGNESQNREHGNEKDAAGDHDFQQGEGFPFSRHSTLSIRPSPRVRFHLNLDGSLSNVGRPVVASRAILKYSLCSEWMITVNSSAVPFG